MTELVVTLSANGMGPGITLRTGERLTYQVTPSVDFDGAVRLVVDERSRGTFEFVAFASTVLQSEPAVRRVSEFRFEVVGRTAGDVLCQAVALPKILDEWRNRDGRGILRITEAGLELGDEVGGLVMGADGTLVVRGSATTWDDLRFPAQGINPPGAASDPTVEVETGLLLFSPTQTNVVAGVAQLPHSWVEGSVVIPHVHWQKTAAGAGNVLWRFEYDNIVNPGEISDLTYANVMNALTPVPGTPDDNAARRNLISSFGDLAMTDKRISACILWKLSRIGGDAADTYASNARLVEFDIHYEIDGFGSNEQFEK